MAFSLVFLAGFFLSVNAAITTSRNSTFATISNGNLSASMSIATGAILGLSVDEVDLLGGGASTFGLYADCVCTPAGSYTPGRSSGSAHAIELLNGTDSTGVDWAGLLLNDTYTPTGQVFQQYWFLRDGETGLHAFTRIAYHNTSSPVLDSSGLQELRQLFRPANTSLWTHLTIDANRTAPFPSVSAAAAEATAQDATFWLGNTPDDSFYQQWNAYYTKYIFSDPYRTRTAHGIMADGTQPATGGEWMGAWLVMNTKDSYFGGPLHSDLLVDARYTGVLDGITYNYISSNHHGDGVPNITDGFDRTFGPQFFYFNKGSSQAAIQEDAEGLADPAWNTDFYDSLVGVVPGYMGSASRGEFNAFINLPAGSLNPIAVLSANGLDFQDNTQDVDAYQYWGEITDGVVAIPRVKSGIYRLTVYAEGIFGQYVQDGVSITAGSTTSLSIFWEAESAGHELWRLGVPDRSSGEYRHGRARDPGHPLHPEEYRQYWGQYNFTADFPDGVHFTIGESDEAVDWNYVQWSVYGPTFTDPTRYILSPNWTIAFGLESSDIPAASNAKATFTIQLAGVSTASGNTDTPSGLNSNMTLSTIVNNHHDPGSMDMLVEWYHSSSCAVRSGVVCYNIAEKIVFPAEYLLTGRNEIVLSIPFDTRSVYVQYDALRLEVDV